MSVQHSQSRQAVSGAYDLVSKIAHHLDRVSPHIRIVFDDQHGFALPGPWSDEWLRRQLQKRFIPTVTGQIELHASALSHLAVNLNMPAGLLHKPVDWERPNPVPWPVSFVVKKGSNAFSTTSSGMPEPASVTNSPTYWPGDRSACIEQ